MLATRSVSADWLQEAAWTQTQYYVDAFILKKVKHVHLGLSLGKRVAVLKSGKKNVLFCKVAVCVRNTSQRGQNK